MASFQDKLKSKIKQVSTDIGGSAVSGFIVKRLIVKGSFKNVSGADGKIEGFQVQIKNRLGVATIVGLAPVKIDGELFGTEIISIRKGDMSLAAADISNEAAYAVGFGDEFTIFVKDAQGLEAGSHMIALGIDIAGAGMVETQFEEALAGAGVPKREKKSAAADKPKSAVGADGGDFADIMKRMIEMTIEHVGAKKLAEHYKVVRGIVIDFKNGEKYGVEIEPDGSAKFVSGAIDGDRVLKIILSKNDFHKMARGELNPGLAFAKGDIKIEGVSLLKLRGMDEIITAIFKSYTAISSGVSYDEAQAAPTAGAFEGYIAMALMGLDKALKTTDKALGMVGVKFFYEKTLNRIENTWEILDRQIRGNLTFGRTEPAAGSKPAEAEKVSQEPAGNAAASDGLTEKLRERMGKATAHRSADASGYLAGRLILAGSLAAFSENDRKAGFELKLKNRFASATIASFKKISLDGSTYMPESIQIKKAAKIISAADVSDKKPFQLPFGDEIILRVKTADAIDMGKHRIGISADIVGFGEVDLIAEENLSVK